MRLLSHVVLLAQHVVARFRPRRFENGQSVSIGSGLLALLVAAGLAGGLAVPAQAQQPVPQDQKLKEARQRFQEVADRLRKRGNEAAAQQLEARLKSEELSGSDRGMAPSPMRAKVQTTDLPTLQPQQSFVVPQNPSQRLNLDLTGAPASNFPSKLRYAGDVNDDGTADYLYTKQDAGDDRSMDPSDVTGKSVLFLGKSSLSKTEDQLVYDVLKPAGDLDGDGHDDALAIDVDNRVARIYRGTDSGYQDSGETFSIENLFPLNLGRVDVYGFTDFDGDGTDDVLLVESFQFPGLNTQSGFKIGVVFGDNTDISNLSLGYYDVFDGSNYFGTYNAADLNGDGKGEVVRAVNGGGFQIYSFSSQDRSLAQEQSFTATDAGGTVQYNLNFWHRLLDVNNDGTREIVTTWGDSLYAFPATGDLTYSSDASLLAGRGAPTPVGDLNADGTADFYSFNGSSETSYVSFGPVDLTSASDTLTFDTEIPYPSGFGGGPVLPKYGRFGDLNDDGTDDALLDYAPDEPDASPYEAGRLFVLGEQGSESNQTMSTETVAYQRRFADRAVSTANVGDVNDDGIDDVATPFFDRASVGIHYGGSSISDAPDFVLDTGEVPYVASGGDFNGDGERDVAVVTFGSDRASSQINIFLGQNGSLGSTPDHTITFDDEAPAGYDNGFYHLANAGDLNGNGADDLVVSAPFSENDNGENLNQVFVYYGGSSLPSTADVTIDYASSLGTNYLALGYRLSGAGDFNGDGIDDVAIGIGQRENENGSVGAVDIFYGADGGLTTSSPGGDLRLTPGSPDIGGFSEASVRGGKDVNGDGADDLVVASGTFRDSTNGSPVETAAHVYYGGDGDGLGDATVDEGYKIPAGPDAQGPGAIDLNRSGFANRNSGSITLADFDRDGVADIVLNSGFQVGGPNALLYLGGAAAAPNSGVRRGPDAVFEAPNTRTSLGGAYRAAAGDFTGNGAVDFFATQSRDDNDADLSSRMYRYGVSSVPVAVASRSVATNGETDFFTTGVTIDFTGLSGEGSVRVEKALDPPLNPSGVNPDSVITRFLIEGDGGLEVGAGTKVQFDTSKLDTERPGELVIYKRSTTGQGVFSGLETTFDGDAGTVTATVESFGEFALAYPPDAVTVWAGDTNNDGTVNQDDVLPLGMYWDQSGPARDETGCDWAGDNATPWSPEEAAYADANGDGVVNQDDVLCVGLNWGETRSTSSSAVLAAQKAGDEPAGTLELRRQEDSGSGFWVELHAREVNALMGVATELTFDPDVVSVMSVEPGARMGESALLQSHTDEENGTLGFGISRKGTAASKAAADGPVVRVKLRSKTAEPEIGLRDGQATTAKGRTVSLAVEGDLNTLPDEVTLEAPAPNPVRQQTTLRYALPEAQQVRLTVYDVLGREVAVLVDEKQKAGEKQVTVNASQWSSGTYFYRLNTGETTITERLTIVR